MVCADFGLLWQVELNSTSSRWDCLGFAPSGAAWRLLAPSSANCLWALDIDGRLWVHFTPLSSSSQTVEEKGKMGERKVAQWIKVSSPRVSDVSCSPDGKVSFDHILINSASIEFTRYLIPSGMGHIFVHKYSGCSGWDFSENPDWNGMDACIRRDRFKCVHKECICSRLNCI